MKIFPNMRRITLIACDAVSVLLVTMLIGLTLGSIFPENSSYEVLQVMSLYAVLASITLFFYWYNGHYSWRTPWWQQVGNVVSFCACAMVINVLLNYIAVPGLTAQPILVLAWGASILGALGMRLVGRRFLKKIGHWNIATIVIGNPYGIIDTLYALKSEFYLSYDILYVVINKPDDDSIAALRAEHPAVEIRSTHGILPSHSMVILCPGEHDEEMISSILPDIKDSGAKFAIVPPTSGLSLYGMQPQYFFGHNMALLETRADLRTSRGSLVKDIFDRTLAGIGLLMLAPLFALLIYRVRKDGGPAFYNQLRVGKNGKMFKCWKFRSMDVNADKLLQEILATSEAAREEWAKDFKLKDDPRITKIGHFLRKSSLDEIPQLYNVLRGDMSLVGPRPIVKAEEVFYGDKLEYYLSARPGITGLWQVSGRNDVSYEQRVAFDCWYVRNWSVWNDLVILFKTTFVVLQHKGAY